MLSREAQSQPLFLGSGRIDGAAGRCQTRLHDHLPASPIVGAKLARTHRTMTVRHASRQHRPRPE
jgi:hypothetical protein